MSQAGHIVRRGGARKTWSIRYRDPSGVLQWEGKFKTRHDAQKRLNEVLGEIDKGTYTRRSSVTFEKFAEDWLASRRQIRGSTEAGYGSIISRQLVPRLGAIAVADLRFEHVDAVVSGMIEDELSPKTIHNAVTLLRTILTGRKGPSALRRGVAFRDSTLGIELPPLQSRQIIPPTPEQMWKLINTAKEIGGLGYPLTYLAAFTGVRRNEALALRFDDVGWFTNEVNVRHAISKRRRKDGGQKWEWHVGPPKSRKSVRRIAATESVMKMLAELKVGKPGSAFLFPGRCSGFIDPDMFDAEVWKLIAVKAGMPGTRFHDLRHFFASQLIANGETAAYVRDQMGHSSIKVTFDTYGHLFPGRGKEASDRYEKAMRDAREKCTADVRKTFAIDGEEKGGSDATN
ncbi:MAG TPA: site-specific integrase [Bryobacteraceae bacterium]|nr:site-specific integrase [Bryobacteraceae bacterium]